jgi:hypothetical protein
MKALNETSRVLLECDRAMGLPAGMKLVAVIEADDGITVKELSGLLHCGSDSAKGYIKAAVERRWLYKTTSTRDTAAVYRRTNNGNLLTQRLTC